MCARPADYFKFYPWPWKSKTFFNTCAVSLHMNHVLFGHAKSLNFVACLSYITQGHPHNYSSSHDRVYCPRCTAAMGRSGHNNYFDNVVMGQKLSLPYWVGSTSINQLFLIYRLGSRVLTHNHMLIATITQHVKGELGRPQGDFV